MKTHPIKLIEWPKTCASFSFCCFLSLYTCFSLADLWGGFFPAHFGDYPFLKPRSEISIWIVFL